MACLTPPLEPDDLLAHMLFISRAPKNIIIPAMCSRVQELWKAINDKKRVMALRAVPTIDMLKAPNRLVMAPAHDDPSRPVKLKKNRTRHLRRMVQV